MFHRSVIRSQRSHQTGTRSVGRSGFQAGGFGQIVQKRIGTAHFKIKRFQCGFFKGCDVRNLRIHVQKVRCQPEHILCTHAVLTLCRNKILCKRGQTIAIIENRLGKSQFLSLRIHPLYKHILRAGH